MVKTKKTCLISDKDAKLIKLGLINKLVGELIVAESSKKSAIAGSNKRLEAEALLISPTSTSLNQA